MSDSLAVFLSTVDPVAVMKERLGPSLETVRAESFSSPAHKRMIADHERVKRVRAGTVTVWRKPMPVLAATANVEAAIRAYSARKKATT